MAMKGLLFKASLAMALILPLQAHAQEAYISEGVTHTGVSGLWVLANISYAGMRAQHNRSALWRILCFIFGFPGTLVTLLAVDEGSCRAYGIDLPKRME